MLRGRIARLFGVGEWEHRERGESFEEASGFVLVEWKDFRRRIVLIGVGF